MEGTKIKLHTKRQKKKGETIKGTSGCVRPEWVNKWPTNIIADDDDDDDDNDDDDDDDDGDTKFFPHESYKSSCTSYFMVCTIQIYLFLIFRPSFLLRGGHLFTQYINHLPSLSTIYKLHGMFGNKSHKLHGNNWRTIIWQPENAPTQTH